jgi:transcriptional regulator with XRE-family HTH domain
MKVGGVIAKLRAKRGLTTRAQLSEASGVARQVIERIEGGSTPSIATLGKLAKALGTTTGEILREAERGQKKRKGGG